MKLESLVIANQHVAVNTFSGLKPWELAIPEAGGITKWSEPSKVGPMTGVKS